MEAGFSLTVPHDNTDSQDLVHMLRTLQINLNAFHLLMTDPEHNGLCGNTREFVTNYSFCYRNLLRHSVCSILVEAIVPVGGFIDMLCRRSSYIRAVSHVTYFESIRTVSGEWDTDTLPSKSEPKLSQTIDCDIVEIGQSGVSFMGQRHCKP